MWIESTGIKVCVWILNAAFFDCTIILSVLTPNENI